MKVLATNNFNLTDARYFAARLVDYIIFAPSLCSEEGIPVIKEIQSWIEGVRWGIEVSNVEVLPFLVEETGIDVCLTAVHVPIDLFATRIMHKQTDLTPTLEGDAILLPPDDPTELPDSQTVFVEWPIGADMPTRSHIDGLAIRGSGEEKIGVKSFDQLDHMFDQIDVLRGM